MIQRVMNVFRIPELRQRIILTVSLLAVYRIGFQVPIPGINTQTIADAADKQFGESSWNQLFGLFNTFSGGGLTQGALFSLGIMPYISASIIFSLLTKVVPALEKLSKDGSSGRKKISQYTRYATVPLCLVQGFFIVQGLFRSLVAGGQAQIVDPDLFNSFGWKVMAILALTTGTIFLMWLGEQITEHGIGNGISLLIMAGIISRLPAAVARYTSSAEEFSTKVTSGLILLVMFVAVIWIVVFITKGQRRIPIQAARFSRGRRTVGGQRHYLPLQVNQAGVMPVIFASSLLMIPGFLLGAIGLQGAAGVFNDYSSWWYVVFYGSMIYFFSYFWNTLMVQPTEIANNMKEHGSFIPGIRPGRRTAEYLERVLMRVTLAGATFLAFIAIVPQIFAGSLTVEWSISTFIGGTSILIVASVALDLVDKINSHLLMRNYEGFMRRGKGAR